LQILPSKSIIIITTTRTIKNVRIQPHPETESTIMCILYKYAFMFALYNFHIIIYHYSSILHAKYCTPSTWIGLLQSPFVATTPHCISLQWIIYYGGIYIRHTWMIVGMFIVHTFISWKTLNEPIHK